MLLSTTLALLAPAASTLSYQFNNVSNLNALEHAANSRLPNVPLPTEINDSTRHLLQFMAIWTDIEVCMYANTTTLVSQNATGYQDSKHWTHAEVSGIMSRHKAMSELWNLYILSLLEHFDMTHPPPCGIKEPLSGISLSIDIRGFQQLNTLFVDALQNASPTWHPLLTPSFWAMSTARAEQNGFYSIFNDGFPAERAFLTSLSPALAWGSFTQVLRDCPFVVGEVFPVAVPMFADRFGERLSYCANLSAALHVEDVQDLYVEIDVGVEVPIVVRASNVTLNGTVVEFDIEYPRDEDVLEGLVNTALVKGKGGQALATAWIQIEQPLDGDTRLPGDLTCPRNGGTYFWELIGP